MIPTYSYIAAEYISNNTSNYKLLICISSLSFSYMVVHNNEILVLEQFNIDVNKSSLNELMENNSFITKTYETVNIAYVSPYSTLIPKEYNNDSAQQALDILYDEDIEFRKVFNDYSKPYGLYVYYKVANDIVRTMISQYPLANSFNIQTLMLDQLIPIANQTVQVCVIGFTYVIQLFNDSKLQLSKTFICDSNQTFLYHILAFCKMYQLNPEEVSFEFLGWINEDSVLFELVKKYFVHVSVLKNNNLTWQNTDFIAPQYAVLYQLLNNSN
jgi:hypothetical protein